MILVPDTTLITLENQLRWSIRAHALRLRHLNKTRRPLRERGRMLYTLHHLYQILQTVRTAKKEAQCH